MDSLTSVFLLPAARKRASGVRDVQLSSMLILGQLMPDVLGSTAPELPMTLSALQLAELFL